MTFDQYTERVFTKLNSMRDLAAEMTPNVIIALIFLIFIFLMSKLVKKSIASIMGKSAAYTNLAKVLARVASIIINMLGVLIASGIIFPSVTPANLFSLLGVGGVAIGFAFKDIFQNFLSGILILLLQSFKIGDQIEVDGVEGTVEDIEIRATVIRTYDNRKVIIPNSNLFTNKVTINTAYDKRRISVFIGIGYGDDISQAKQVILDTVSKIDGILKDPSPYVLVINYGGSSVDLEIRFWLSPPRRLDILQMQDAVMEALKPALFQAGIDLPFPTQQILFHDQTEETDGDRKTQREGYPSRGEKDPKSRFHKLEAIKGEASDLEN